MKKRTLLFVSLGLIVVGFLASRVGDNLSNVNKSGMLQESALMPIGAIMVVVGVLIRNHLFLLISFLNNKGRQKQETSDTSLDSE